MGEFVILLKIAARNLFRNKRRTILASLAIGIGLAALVFTDAVYIGMRENLIGAGTDTFLGHGQIHAEGFRDSLAVEATVHDGPEVLRRLREEPEIEVAAPRVLAFAMVTSAANVESILLYGIDPKYERPLSKLDEAIRKGAFLPEEPAGLVLIGQRLAETLEVDVGDRLVLTSAQAGTGELSQSMFRVGGIYAFQQRDIDANAAFVHLSEAQELLGLGEAIHEIAFRFTDVRLSGDRTLPFWSRYGRDGNEALGWRDLLPQLDAMFQVSKYSTFIVAAILFGIVAFGIMNTLFMSLYERMFEFGVLRAIGTRPSRMALIILLEASTLAIVSIVLGAALGLAATAIGAHVGLDYGGIEYAGVTFREPVRPVFQVRQYYIFPVWVFLFTVAAGIYPALYAARLTPAEAMQRSL